MKKKINLTLLFGGQSIEHEVSHLSARFVLEHLNKERYELSVIGIDREGKWHWLDPENPSFDAPLGAVTLFDDLRKVDVAFPIFHGKMGEDGTVQGLLELAGVPYVGASVLGSAIGMDKDVMKRLLKEAGLPVAPFSTIRKEERPYPRFEQLAAPLFVKPVSGGSSIGISKVRTQEEYEAALELAFLYDQKVLVEQEIVGREIEVGVIGNTHPMVSIPCEIKASADFQSYDSKYIDPEAAKTTIPAPLRPDELTLVHQTAIRAYKVLECTGYARVDLFLAEEGSVYVNELNTIPGLAPLSPFAKMWEASGLPPEALLDQLIQYAQQAHREKQSLTNHYQPQGVLL